MSHGFNVLSKFRGRPHQASDDLFVFPVGHRVFWLQADKDAVYFLPESSMRKWRMFTFLRSVQRSMSPLKTNIFSRFQG